MLITIATNNYVLSNSESVQCNFFIFDHVTFIQFNICCCRGRIQEFEKGGGNFPVPSPSLLLLSSSLPYPPSPFPLPFPISRPPLIQLGVLGALDRLARCSNAVESGFWKIICS